MYFHNILSMLRFVQSDIEENASITVSTRTHLSLRWPHNVAYAASNSSRSLSQIFAFEWGYTCLQCHISQ